MSLSSRSVPRILLMLVLVLVVTVMIVPSSALDFLRFQYGWVEDLVDFLFTITPGFDMEHLGAFAVLGFVVRFGWPHGRAWHVALALLCVAGFSELAQLWSPGREASVFHAVLEMLGGMTGFGLAWLVGFAWGEHGVQQQ